LDEEDEEEGVVGWMIDCHRGQARWRVERGATAWAMCPLGKAST